ncbi:MAG: glycosyltransferase family 4 protein [Burkholderiales bacterium]|nr:glycosyltransferase family 4 protein [Burkholderiales bacterium]
MKIAHVVRRYGAVGGMEKYVLELTRELAKRGHEITVVCEKKICEDFAGIETHEMGSIRQRPRWLSLLRFSNRVTDFFENYPKDNLIIHSHERLGIHDITTFHGPPFATIREKPLWKRLSLRIRMQLWLERRELLSPSVKAVVPNSPLIKKLLEQYYPDATLLAPIPPGVDPVIPGMPREVPAQGGVIGFVGREWKRKGLDMALAIARKLREKRPELKMLIIGPDPEDIRPASSLDYCICPGWKNHPDFSSMDMLLHPAKAEPYGMVIAEALSSGVPVVISDRCGFAPYLPKDSGEILNLEQDVTFWAEACDRQLSRTSPPEPFRRSWEDVAKDYEKIYLEMEKP